MLTPEQIEMLLQKGQLSPAVAARLGEQGGGSRAAAPRLAPVSAPETPEMPGGRPDAIEYDEFDRQRMLLAMREVENER